MTGPKDRTIDRDIKRVNGIGRIKDHRTWCDEYKPWAYPPWPYEAIHTSLEAHYLYRTVFNLGKGNYATLGVYLGGSTNALVCGAAPHGGHVYGIDLFEANKMYPELLDEDEVMRAFDDRGTEKFVSLCTGSTSAWAEKLSHLKFKLIFIDADHTYNAVLEDFKLWRPLLEEGGLIAFHDIDMDSVHRVITEELNDWELVDHVFRIKTFKRKEGLLS